MISVIIPVYNCAEYLPRCLTSILNNTYKNLQIICIDDGSTDNSLMVIKKFAEQDSRILVIHQENKGVSTARNVGLQHAVGKYVAFVDADDWVHSQYFEVLSRFIETQNSDVVLCDWKRITERSIVHDNSEINIETLPYEWLQVGGVSSNFANRYVWGKLFRKELLCKHSFPEEISFCEDRAFNISVFGDICNAKILYVKNPLYFYFVSRADSAINTFNVSRQKKVIWWFLHQSEKCDSPTNALYLTEGFKMLLAIRLGYSGTSDFTKEEERNLVKYALRCIRETQNYPLSWRLMFEIQGRFPFIYNLLRKNTLVKKVTKRV